MSIQEQADARTFGVEIEARGMSVSEANRELQTLIVSNPSLSGWKVVPDGTYDVDFEFVSPVLQGLDGHEQIKLICQLLNDLGCNVNKKCGLHVHIGVRDLTAAELANSVNRYNFHSSNIDRHVAQSRRSGNNTFCKDHTSKISLTDSKNLQATSQRGRYYKMNLKSYLKHGTLENRHHQGTLNASKISAWIKFVSCQIEIARVEIASIVEVTPATPTTVRSAVSQLSSKQQLVFNAISNHSLNASEIASRINSTAPSVQSMVCRMRRSGIRIVTSYGLYRIQSSSTPTPTTTVSRVERKPLFFGFESRLTSFFARRSAQLGCSMPLANRTSFA